LRSPRRDPRACGRAGGQTNSDGLEAFVGAQGRVLDRLRDRVDRASQRALEVALRRVDRDLEPLDGEIGLHARGRRRVLGQPPQLTASRVERATGDRELRSLHGEPPSIDADRVDHLDLVELLLVLGPPSQRPERFVGIEAQERAERAVEPVGTRLFGTLEGDCQRLLVPAQVL